MGKIKELELPEDISVLDSEKIYAVIIWNDDFNTFEFVTECLIRYCGHEPEQAEQCTYLIHFKGKSDVKRGDKSRMKKIYDKLKSCGLTTTMEEL